MSLTAITANALAGLNASQAGLRTVSTNITNANTPGYGRQEIRVTTQTIAGLSGGVTVEGVRRVTDAYLVNASLDASARQGASRAMSELLDRAQAAFGDPTKAGSLFNGVNEIFAGLAEVAADPGSSVRRAASIGDVAATLAEVQRVAGEIQALRGEADARIGAAVDRVNALLQDFTRLNSERQRGLVRGDASGAENAIAALVDELSSFLDVRTVTRGDGTLELRTGDGQILAGHQAAALSYAGGGAAGPERVYPELTIAYGHTSGQPLTGHLKTGELKGLLDLRDRELPDLALALGEYGARIADALNAAHAESAAYPPPSALVGRSTGLIGTDAHNFSGVATIAVIGAGGTLANTIELDFAGGQVRVDGAAVGALGLTMAGVEAGLDAAFAAIGGGGDARFTNGVLELDAPAGRGLAFVAEPLSAGDANAARGGRSFAHFFGLNDLVVSNETLFFETGFAATDGHAFATGQEISLHIASATGKKLAEITVAATSGQTFGQLISDLNTAASAYGVFALDGAGALSFTPSAAHAGARVSVLEDHTQRSGSGASFSDLFGLGDGPRAGRATGMAVRADIAADTALLAVGRVSLAGAAVNDVVLGAGDGAGAQALVAAAERRIGFAAAGALPAATTSLIDYGGRLAGDAGRRASAAGRQLAAAETLFGEASARRASVEGVNIEEEMVKLTVYQQSFNAASRLIQASKDMTDALLAMV